MTAQEHDPSTNQELAMLQSKHKGCTDPINHTRAADRAATYQQRSAVHTLQMAAQHLALLDNVQSKVIRLQTS